MRYLLGLSMILFFLEVNLTFKSAIKLIKGLVYLGVA